MKRLLISEDKMFVISEDKNQFWGMDEDLLLFIKPRRFDGGSI